MIEKIRIEYCITCNYRPMAASLALRIREATGLDSELIGSQVAGAFEVSMGEVVLHSKLATRVFPDFGDLSRKLRKP